MTTIVNEWHFLAHPLFLDQIEKLAAAVERTRTKDPRGWRKSTNAKLLAALLQLAFDKVGAWLCLGNAVSARRSDGLDDLHDYMQPQRRSSPRAANAKNSEIVVTDDWPMQVQIGDAELRVIEGHLRKELDALFVTCREHWSIASWPAPSMNNRRRQLWQPPAPRSTCGSRHDARP